MGMSIELHTWNTPNGHKVSIALEELGLDYELHPVNILADEQFAPAFLAISPNNKIPALVDSQGPEGKPIHLFESGAILLYLAEKTGKLMPASKHGQYDALQWLMWQMGGFGPMLGQSHHFNRFAKVDVPYARERYSKESNRLYGVLNKRLSDTAYLAGEALSIADIATWPWAARWEWQGVDMADYPAVKRWFDSIADRDAVKRALASYQTPAFQRRP